MRIAAIIMAASVLASAPSMADERTVPHDPGISVVVIDSAVRRIDFSDPNTSLVNLTPEPPEGTKFDDNKVNDAYSHGDIVASSFVREMRKIDPGVHITIYTIDPFVRRSGSANCTFDMGSFIAALPKLRTAGVRVAVVAFGTANRAAGQSIADNLASQNVALFAALPNEQGDPGIYPAANKGVISVAGEAKDGAFSNDRALPTWITLAISGNHESAHNSSDASGNSFSVAHAAAYGAYVMRAKPDTPTSDLAQAISSYGIPMRGSYDHKQYVTVRIGGRAMIQAIIGAYGAMPAGNR